MTIVIYKLFISFNFSAYLIEIKGNLVLTFPDRVTVLFAAKVNASQKVLDCITYHPIQAFNAEFTNEYTQPEQEPY